ncbi:MAG: hypothetical protein U1E78_02025 [Gammaproteobacteria bacterium]
MLGKRAQYEGMPDYNCKKSNCGLLWKYEKNLENETIHTVLNSYRIGGYQSILETNNVSELNNLLLDPRMLLEYMADDKKNSNSYGIRTAFSKGNKEIFQALLSDQNVQLFTLLEIFDYIFAHKNSGSLSDVPKCFFEPDFLNMAVSIATKYENPVLLNGLEAVNEIIELAMSGDFEAQVDDNTNVHSMEISKPF